METKFNFKSQVCTSRSQSERLLSLGLKKETADMRRPHYNEHSPWVIDKEDCLNEHWLPAWSLHRLWELANIKYIILDSEDEIAVLYDEVIMKIEQFIKEGYFNKKYLENEGVANKK